MHVYFTFKAWPCHEAAVIGPQHHSQDLPQGGLELPCLYKYNG